MTIIHQGFKKKAYTFGIEGHLLAHPKRFSLFALIWQPYLALVRVSKAVIIKFVQQGVEVVVVVLCHSLSLVLALVSLLLCVRSTLSLPNDRLLLQVLLVL